MALQRVMYGQLWKMNLGTLLYAIGGSLMLYGLVENPAFAVVGVAVSSFGFAFCCLTICCPNCGSRWYWLGAKELKFGWAKKLISLSECPACGHPGPSVGA